ncbi:MAG: toxin co-regulated pilus biosynthesis Q family protein [Alphaproteobacteria bacterium]|nr:toxin co-regulated pilus biosynthesis Q family protein [Alphaproteobacteria bacterium]
MQILSPLGSWNTASGEIDVGDGRSITYCAISNNYRDNGRLEFYGTDGSLAAIKIDFPGRSFNAGQSFDVALGMPGGYASQVKGAVVNTSTLILNVKGDNALASFLHNGKLLYVGIEGQRYPFSLSGINRFGERMRTCSGPGWGELIHDYVFQGNENADAKQAIAAREGIDSETLEILVAPPKADSGVVMEDIPNEMPQSLRQPPPPPAPAYVPPSAPEPEVAVMRPRPVIPTPVESHQPVASLPPPAYEPPPMTPGQETLPPMPPRGRVLASISEEQQPPVSVSAPNAAPTGGFDELFEPQTSPAPATTQVQPQVQSHAEIVVQAPPPAPAYDPPQMAAPVYVPPAPPVTVAPPPQMQVQSQASQQPPAQAQLKSSPPPQWRALKGSSLREVLALWSLDSGVELIWNADEQYRIKETISLNSSYESAVEQLLKQYEPDFFSPAVRRPVGQLYVDPAQNKRVLVIRSQAG